MKLFLFSLIISAIFSINSFATPADSYIDQTNDILALLEPSTVAMPPNSPCKSINLSQDQIEKIKTAATTTKRSLIQAKANFELAMFDYKATLTDQKSDLKMAETRANDMLNAGTVIPAMFLTLANDILFNVLDATQRPQLVACMEMVKKMHQMKKGQCGGSNQNGGGHNPNPGNGGGH